MKSNLNLSQSCNDTVVIIPTYNNATTLADVIKGVLEFSLPIIVVNDGSTDNTQDVLSQFDNIEVITYPQNKGKGKALNLGLKKAIDEGYRYAITLDSDGQHYPSEISKFLAEIEKEPDSLIIGARNLTADNMPGKNSFANKFSNFWVIVETGLKLDDTQSGFRLYPLRKLKNVKLFTSKYEYELEIIVQLAWRNVTVKNIPIQVYYPDPEERISHFRPLRDFTRISVLNTFLVLIALLWFWPMKFFKWLSPRNIKQFFMDNLIQSKDSNATICYSIMLGVFMGIVPIWGYQMIAAGFIAHFLRLNKVITLLASNISIPPMIPFLLFGSYMTGALILNNPLTLDLGEITFESIKDSMLQYLIGSVAFAIICSVIAGIVSVTMLSLFRKPSTQNQ